MPPPMKSFGRAPALFHGAGYQTPVTTIVRNDGISRFISGSNTFLPIRAVPSSSGCTAHRRISEHRLAASSTTTIDLSPHRIRDAHNPCVLRDHFQIAQHRHRPDTNSSRVRGRSSLFIKPYEHSRTTPTFPGSVNSPATSRSSLQSAASAPDFPRLFLPLPHRPFNPRGPASGNQFLLRQLRTTTRSSKFRVVIRQVQRSARASVQASGCHLRVVQHVPDVHDPLRRCGMTIGKHRSRSVGSA